MEPCISIVRKSKLFSLIKVKGGGIPEMYILKDLNTGNVSPPMKKDRHLELISFLRYSQVMRGGYNNFSNTVEFNNAATYILESGDLDYHSIKGAI